MAKRKTGVNVYKPRPLSFYVKRAIKPFLPKKRRSTKRKVKLS